MHQNAVRSRLTENTGFVTGRPGDFVGRWVGSSASGPNQEVVAFGSFVRVCMRAGGRIWLSRHAFVPLLLLLLCGLRVLILRGFLLQFCDVPSQKQHYRAVHIKRHVLLTPCVKQ